jgi:hypothetical protein
MPAPAAQPKRPPSLADELAKAHRAVTAPRTRVTELQRELDTAVSRGHHQEAASLQAQLTEAREAQLIAEARVTALLQAQEVMQREEAARQEAEQRQQRADQAQIAIAAAMAAEREALDGIRVKLDLLWGCVGAAQGAYREARELELEAGRARRRMLQARVTSGDLAEMPNHITAPNTVSVLAERDPLIRELARWSR